MKKIIKGLAVSFLIILTTCDKAPLNADVEGHWRLESFTVLETSETIQCTQLFYGITRMVTEVARKSGNIGDVSFVARTAYEEGETVLVLRNFKIKTFNSDTGEKVDSAQLLPFGISNPIETRFQIKQVNGNKLVLESDYAQLYLKRF